MFHGFDYPDETGKPELHARFWRPTMINGRIRFDRPDDCTIRKYIRPMNAKMFQEGENLRGVDAEAVEWAP